MRRGRKQRNGQPLVRFVRPGSQKIHITVNLGENGRVSLSVSKGVITNGNLLSIYLKSKVLCTVLRDTSSSVIVMIYDHHNNIILFSHCQ